MLKGKDENTPVHYDSRVDRFNKRLQLVRQQLDRGVTDVTEDDVRHVSLYEFWWKFSVYRGRVRKATRPVCLMVTPSYSADCACVEHVCHESYARAAVLAYWRHMPTLARHNALRAAVKDQAVPSVCYGATLFVEEFFNPMFPGQEQFLGTRSLHEKFEGHGARDGKGNPVGWTLALMEMLTDPMLLQWVPRWVVEQYERANPFSGRRCTL